MTSIGRLTVEHLRTDAGGVVRGIGLPAPRLSWTIEDAPPGWVQGAATIEWTPAGGAAQTAAIEGADQVLVPWPFSPLGADSAGSIRVVVRGGADGATDECTCEPVGISTGPLQPADWAARFISPAGLGGPDDAAPIVFTDFELPAAPASAELSLTALGSALVTINGLPVSDEVLSPGWTSYRHRLRFRSVDVTSLLRAGTNRIEALLGNGWYRGHIGWDRRRDHYGDRLALLAQLKIIGADATTRVVATDDSWQARASGVLSDDIYDGQTTDLRLMGDLRSTGDDRSAEPVEVLDRDLSTVVPAEGPPVRITERLPAREVFRSPSGRLLIDFGQNLVGFCRLTVNGAAGDEIVLRHAEVLEDGELAVGPLRSAKATDTYFLADTAGDQILQPHFTFHGFRYAEVTGVDDLAPGQIEACVVHSDLERAGWFSCSDDRLNQLHRNVVWGMRGNFVDVPTDCPQRDERLGWTGDLQVFSPTATFLYDSVGFLSSWLRDLAADQQADGSVPFVVPDVLSEGKEQFAAAWSDAAAVVPLVVHTAADDLDLVRRQFSSMRAWVDKIVSVSPDDRWVGGFQFGDWLDPTAPESDPAAAQLDPDVMASAYLVHSVRQVAKAAELIGDDAAATHYAELAGRARAAFQQEYVTANGRVLSDCQSAYAIALVWDLLAGGQRAAAGRRLVELVRGADFRVATGFVGSPLILEALVQVGRPDLAYRMLLQDQNPSWLYPTTMGATTIWERWDALLPDGSVNGTGMTSFNHYAFGAVADFLHSRVAGLEPIAAGWRRVRIAPLPGGALTSAEVSHLSPYGRIQLGWQLSGCELTVAATLPVGVEAEVNVPGLDPVTVGHGAHQWTGSVIEPDRTLATIGDVIDDAEVWGRVCELADTETDRGPGSAIDDVSARLAHRVRPYLAEPVDRLAVRLGTRGDTPADELSHRVRDVVAAAGSTKE